MEIDKITYREVSKLRIALRWGMALGVLLLIAAPLAHLTLDPLIWYRSLPVIIPLAAGATLVLSGAAANYRWLGSALVRRKTLIVANVCAMIILALVNVVLVNLIANRHYRRIDLTSKGIFSLSDHTRDFLSAIDRGVEVTALFSEDPEIAWLRTRLNDLMDEYAVRSPMVKFEPINVDANPARAREFTASLGTELPRNAIVLRSGENAHILRWSDLVESRRLDSGEEDIRFRGEQVITAAMKSVVMDTQPMALFTIGHGERDIQSADPDDGFSSIAQALQRENYRVGRINLREAEVIPEECAALIIAGPRSAFQQDEIELIREYLKAGGGLMAMLDPTHLGGDSGGLTELLAEYDIGVRDDVMVVQRVQSGIYAMQLALIHGEKAADHPVSRRASTMPPRFMQAAALNIIRGESISIGPLRYRARTIIQGPSNAWGEKHPDDEARGLKYDAGEDIAGPIPLVVISEPQAEGSTTPSADIEAAHVAVIANSEFVSNRMLSTGDGPGNQQLFTNTVAWLDREGLPPAAIPARDLDFRPLAGWTVARSKFVLILCALFMPLASILFGGFVWFIRRK